VRRLLIATGPFGLAHKLTQPEGPAVSRLMGVGDQETLGSAQTRWSPRAGCPRGDPAEAERTEACRPAAGHS